MRVLGDDGSGPTPRHLYSHITDGLRYAILWKEGGYYLDFDVIVVKNLCGIRNALGDQVHR